MRKSIIRLNCANCRRFFLKIVAGDTPLMIIPCSNCKKVNMFIIENSVLKHKCFDKLYIEPEGSISDLEIKELVEGFKKLELT